MAPVKVPETDGGQVLRDLISGSEKTVSSGFAIARELAWKTQGQGLSGR